MLNTLLKTFVAANFLSAGASQVLGPQNIISKSLGNVLSGSFLGLGEGGSSSGGSELKYLSKVDPEKIKLSGAGSTGTAQPNLSSASRPNQFPMGYKSNLANVSPEIRRLLQDISDGNVGNQNIKLSLYQTPERKIDIG